MSVKTARQIRREVVLPNLTQLQRAIYEAAAPILHAPDVKAYQERVRRKSDRRTWGRTFGTAVPIVFLITAGFAYAGLWALGILAHQDPVVRWTIPILLWALGASFAASCAGTVADMWMEPQLHSAWRSVGWDAFPTATQVVPKPVKVRLKNIRRWCPGVAFTVEYLDADPFLAVEHEGERYYVAVWDETGFIA
jgi:hypothetical protein